MKTTFLSVLFSLCSLLIVQAKTSLPDSPRCSESTYIFRIDKQNLKKVFLRDESITEDMLGEMVGSYIKPETSPELSRGNYVLVEAVGNELNFTEYVVDDLYFRVVPAENFMLCLYDSLGRIVDNAVVKCGSKKLSYDKKTQTYNTTNVKHEQVIEINNKGVYHYIEVENYAGYYNVKRKANVFKKIGWKTRRNWYNVKQQVYFLFNPDERPEKYKFTGFIVFSKPKYKPGETVKLKAYITTKKGKPYNKPADVRLLAHYPFRVDTLLTRLTPYRPGMYEYEFVASDSLHLRLDASYTVSFEMHKYKYNAISESFRYEDYELKGIRFTLNTEKEEYARGDSVQIKLKATDENEMAQYGGRAELYVYPGDLSAPDTGNYEYVFVPDLLWHEEIDMNDVAEKTVTLPDSIFPTDVSLRYTVHAVYLSADNEKKEQSKDLFYDANDYKIDFDLSKGMLTVQQLHKGESLSVEAQITVNGEEGETISKETVRLPYTLPLPWYASAVTVKTKEQKGYFPVGKDIHESPFGYDLYRYNDSIFVRVDNPANIPFWYVVRKGKKDIASGYTTRLNYGVKDKNKGYNLQLSYILGENQKSVTQSLPFAQKNVSLHVTTPTVVYPGQTTDIKISLTDKKGKPVSNADITAYSFTTKFDVYNGLPSIGIKGKAKYANAFKQTYYNPSWESVSNQKGAMTWSRWRNTLSLDAIEYYKFLYPEYYYHYSERTSEGTTLVSPYVVVDGAVQSVAMLWIDDKLYYTNLAEQYGVYVFRVEPGMHTIRFRTHDREVTVKNVYLSQGTKNILSFNAGNMYASVPYENGQLKPLELTSNLLKQEEWGKLSNRDASYLSRQLITIDNNFGWLRLHSGIVMINNPTYIHSGNTYYYINHERKQRFSYAIHGYVNDPLLVGPFPTRNRLNDLTNVASVYTDDKWVTNIGLEGGNRYTVYENYQKIQNWGELPFPQVFPRVAPPTDFRQKPLHPEDIDKMFHKELLSQLKTLIGMISHSSGTVKEHTGRLKLYLDKDVSGKNIAPAMIFLVPEKKEDIAYNKLYYGGTRGFDKLPIGDMTLHLIMDDKTSFSRRIRIQADGDNYVRIDSIAYENNADVVKTAWRLFDQFTEKVQFKNPYLVDKSSSDKKAQAKPNDIVNAKADYESYDPKSRGPETMVGVVLDPEGYPVIGVSIVVQGTTNGTISNIDGEFRLEGVRLGDIVSASYIGYHTQTKKFQPGISYVFNFTEDAQMLHESVVVGYGVVKKSSMGVVSEDLAGRVPGVSLDAATNIMVRGSGSLTGGGSPLIIVNGLPYNGKLEDLDLSLISNMSILKDASATGIYGSRASDGVILIETSRFPINSSEADDADPTGWAEVDNSHSLRRNFHDDAFWQPRLRTNKEGVATFEVTYPDDITSWDAYFVAIGNKKQVDKKQMTIKSFKALTSRLSLPRFAVRGDSLNVVGRIANHLGDDIEAIRKIDVEGVLREDLVRLSASHVDYIPVVATTEGDSLKVTYSLQMANGYFDGEERLIPIYEQGMLQTSGDFRVIDDNETHTLKIDDLIPGTVKIHADASSFDMFLTEIDRVDNYPYFCNEQIASKIKSLLAKERIYKILGKEFKDQSKINKHIASLNKNKNTEGFWGWWNQSDTEFWISKQVLSALLDAEEAGYSTSLDRSGIAAKFERDLYRALSDLSLVDKRNIPYAKQELLDRLIYLKRLVASMDVEPYFRQIDAQLVDHSSTDRLKTMQVMSVIGLEEEIVPDSLMKYAHKTMLGSMYWSEQQPIVPLHRGYLLPYRTNTENTLIAYDILKKTGGHEEELKKIRNYFFEGRRGGYWQNTYESSRIVETILPDILGDNATYSETAMYLNGARISKLPYTGELAAGGAIEIRKEGTLPLFVTAYQQAWNPAPQAEATKGFEVKSGFIANKNTLSFLTAGKVAQLEVVVQVDGEAQYVQIEVPIPAGCSYETKATGFYYGKEAHREHFRDKVVIFSNHLPKGTHEFTVDLIPRYTGVYHLNPAKVELMYFPTFYGNEEMKKVRIE